MTVMTQSRKSSDGLSRRRSISNPVSSPHLEGLDLAALRSYRQQLVAEEDRVSYWRRVAHARMDVLEAQSHTAGVLGFEDLVRALGDTGTGHTRSALTRFHASGPLPELPQLAEMWVTQVDPHDDAAVADALERLHAAEAQLTDYRRALHDRIDEATSELIMRYRSNPAVALVALPRG